MRAPRQGAPGHRPGAVARATAMILCVVPCAAFGLTACGQDTQGPVVARVGGQTIRRAAVDHWTNAIERGAAPVVLGNSHGAPSRREALTFLISADRLTAQAAADGMAVTTQAVEQALQERSEVGGGEFKRHLDAGGQTVADAKLEIETELAAEAIGHMLERRAEEITPQEVHAFYLQNPVRFRLGELRLTDLFEQLPSRAAASALARRIGSGPRFVRHATNHELLFLRPTGDPEQAIVLRAIFAARKGVVTGPMKFQKKWTVFAVRRIVPPRPLSFEMAHEKVAAVLVGERRQQLTATYLRKYRSRWRAITSCRAGYVVQGCRQYAGPLQAEPDAFSVG